LFKFTPLAGYILECVGISSTDINQYYLAGVFGFISRLGIKGVFECIIEYYTIKDKIGDNYILPHSYDRDPLGNSQPTNFANLVKLREEDLIEEPHRKVLFNFDGSINKNLPSEVQRYLEVHKSKAVEKLVKEGYSRPK
jgi:hypothetical protein